MIKIQMTIKFKTIKGKQSTITSIMSSEEYDEICNLLSKSMNTI